MKFYGIGARRSGMFTVMWAKPVNSDLRLCDEIYVRPTASGTTLGENLIKRVMEPQGYVHDSFQRLPAALLSA